MLFSWIKRKQKKTFFWNKIFFRHKFQQIVSKSALDELQNASFLDVFARQDSFSKVNQKRHQTSSKMRTKSYKRSLFSKKSFPVMHQTLFVFVKKRFKKMFFLKTRKKKLSKITKNATSKKQDFINKCFIFWNSRFGICISGGLWWVPTPPLYDRNFEFEI